MINIATFKYYFRWYPFEYDCNEPLWWYNRRTGEVASRDEVDFLSNCQGKEHLEKIMISIPMIDIVEMEKEFLTQHGYTKIKEKMQQDIQYDFDYLFKCFIDNNGLMRTWHLFEGEKLQTAAIEWCKANGIKFTNE